MVSIHSSITHVARTYYDETEVQQRLALLPAWQYRDLALHRSFEFADFTQAFSFMTAVALAAEKANHHPEWYNCYNRVDVSLTTHDAGGVTDKDFELAAICDRFAS